MANFCEILSELRKDRHLTQRQMAEVLHVSMGTISNYETGRYAPSYDTLIKLADYFDVTTDYLLGRTSISLPPRKLEDEYVNGKTMNDIVDVMITFQDNCRDILSRAVEVIRVYNENSQQDAVKPAKK